LIQPIEIRSSLGPKQFEQAYQHDLDHEIAGPTPLLPRRVSENNRNVSQNAKETVRPRTDLPQDAKLTLLALTKVLWDLALLVHTPIFRGTVPQPAGARGTVPRAPAGCGFDVLAHTRRRMPAWPAP